MFAKLYSYIWGENDTEVIVTQETLPECADQNFMVKVENITSHDQIDEDRQRSADEGCPPEAEPMQTCDVEVENGWIHVKDYKVEALSDNESCILGKHEAFEVEKMKRINENALVIIDGDVGKTRSLKVKANKRRHARKRELQVANNTRLEIPLLKELFYKNDDHNLDQQMGDRMMTRKAMKMSNSTALVNSASNKPSRRRFHYTPTGFSGAVNNRKC